MARLALVLATLAGACSEGGDADVRDLGPAVDQAIPPPAAQCTAGQAHLLSVLPGQHTLPRVGYTGTTFVAAWNSSVAPTGVSGHRVDVAVTDLDGVRLGTNLSMTALPVADEGAPSVAPLQGGTVVAWSRVAADGSQIVIDLLDGSGQKLDDNAAPCDPALPDCGVFPVTLDGWARAPALARPVTNPHTATPVQNQVGLAWLQSPTACAGGACDADVYWKKILANGTELVPSEQVSGQAGRYAPPRLAFDGTHEGLLWRDDGQAGRSDLWFAALDAQGHVSSGPSIITGTTGVFASLGPPDLVWDDLDYAVASGGGGDSVLFGRFTVGGATVVPMTGVTFGGVACTPSLAWNGGSFGVVWQTACGQPGSNLAFELTDEQGVRLRSDGQSCGTSTDPLCGVIHLTQNTTQMADGPSLVWAGDHSFAVVWTQTDVTDAGTDSQVYLARIDCR